MRLEVSQTATINRAARRRRRDRKRQRLAEAPLLETSRADRGTVIDSARIAELPLQSRSPMALAVLVAGVNYNAQAVYLRPFDNGALADWSMNGGSNSNNEFLLDGVPNNANQGGNNIAYVPPAEAVQEMKISTNSYDAQYGRTAGGVVNMSLKSGTNAFHGVVYDFMRRKAPGRQLVPAQLAQQPEDRPVHRSVRVQRRWPDLEEQDVLPVHRREVPGRHARAAVQHGADAGDEERRLQRSRGRLGQPDPDLRPGDRPGRERRLDARSVPGQQHPGGIASIRRPGRSCRYYPEPNNVDPALRRGNGTWPGPSTSTRTCSGTGSGRSTTTSARTTGPSSAGPRTSGTRSAIGATPSAAVPPRTASCRSSGPTAPSSATGCTSSAPGRVFNLRGGYTYFLEWS